MLVRKGFVDGDKIFGWVKRYEDKLEKEKWNGKYNSSGRKCLWFGIGVELGFKCSVFQGLKIDRGLDKKCCDLWGGNDWNSLLLYKYNVGCELKKHIDRDIFDKKVVVVNVSEDNLLGGNVRFNYGDDVFILSNGEVVEFDNRVSHGVEKVESERWSLSIRKVLI